MKFLRKIEVVAMFDKRRNTAIRESIDIESPLLRTKYFSLDGLAMPQERLLSKLCVLK